MKRINVFTVKQVKESGGLYDVEVSIKNPKVAVDIIDKVFNLTESANEQFGILCLNTKNKVVGAHILSTGILDSTLVRPREIFLAAFVNNASCIILFHNHPSGDTTPSREDLGTTKRVVEASRIMGLPVIDHIIIGGKDYNGLVSYTSLKEIGEMEGE